MKPLRVYLSYCQADQTYADTVRAALVAAGATVWHDEQFTEFTPRSATQIYDHMVCIPIISPAAVADTRLRLHWAYAARLAELGINRLLLPMLTQPSATFDQHNIPFALATDYLDDPALATQALLHSLGLSVPTDSRSPTFSMLIYQGKSLLAQERYSNAEHLFRQLANAKPTSLEAWLLLGSALNELHRHTEELAAYDQALACQPDALFALGAKCQAMLALRRYPEVLALLDKVLPHAPQDPFMHNLLGYAFAEVQQPAKALDAFQRAVALDVYLLPVLYNAGAMLQVLKRFQEAMVVADQAAAMEPQSGRPYMVKSLIYMHLHQNDAALATLDQAHTLEPSNASAWSTRSWLLTEMGDFGAAKKAIDRAMALDNHNAIVWNNLGWWLFKQGQPHEAMAAYQQALTIVPCLDAAFTNMIHVLMQLGEHDKALAACDQRLVLFPADANVWLRKRAIFRHIGKQRDALLAYGMATKLNPGIARRDWQAQWRSKRTWVTVAIILLVWLLLFFGPKLFGLHER